MKQIRLLPLLVLLAFVAGCGSKTSPTEPAPSRVESATPSRVVVIVGSLDFGAVPINTSAEGVITIRNDGTALMTVTSIQGPIGSGSAFTTTFTGGVIAAHRAINATIRFTPTEPRSYSGTMIVNCDCTSGQNTHPITASGSASMFSRNGSGDTVFDAPSYIQRMRIVGIYNAWSSNFIVKIGGRLIVNELLGVGWGHTVYDGTLLTGGGGVVAITNSNGVAWTFTEVR